MAYVLDCRLDREASRQIVTYDEYFTAEVGHAAWLVCWMTSEFSRYMSSFSTTRYYHKVTVVQYFCHATSG